MRWYGRSIRRRGTYTVVRCDYPLGAEQPPVTEPLYFSDWDDGSCLVWLIPYPGHRGGFLTPSGMVVPKGDPMARALSTAYALMDSPEDARLAADAWPHVSAILYQVRIDHIAEQVRLVRLPLDAGEEVYAASVEAQ
jgi:hypothetical protein